MKIYLEDDWLAEVEIVKDESDLEWDRFTLKVVSTLNKSQIYKPVPDGTVFSVDKQKGAFCGGLWTLHNMGNFNNINNIP